MPPKATPAAQADAFAALLDVLDIDQIDIVGRRLTNHKKSMG
jgi:hypothetical protein